MTTALILLGIVLGVYGLIAFAVVRSDRVLPVAEAPSATAGGESAAARELMNGTLDRATYQANMAAIAAQDAAEHPLTVPKLQQ